MSKVVMFLTELNDVVNELNTSVVKEVIGDSINNNRTLTVSQVIRYLTSRRKSKMKVLGSKLVVAYAVLRAEITSNRPNFRTDAVDINEFLTELEFTSITENGASLRRSLGRRLASAA